MLFFRDRARYNSIFGLFLFIDDLFENKGVKLWKKMPIIAKNQLIAVMQRAESQKAKGYLRSFYQCLCVHC